MRLFAFLVSLFLPRPVGLTLCGYTGVPIRTGYTRWNNRVDKIDARGDAYRLLRILLTDPGVIYVMDKHDLRVGTVAAMQYTEAYRQCGAYNEGRGTRIVFVLGHPFFQTYEDLVHYFLHELVHNSIDEHSRKFLEVHYLYTRSYRRKKDNSPLDETWILREGRFRGYEV